VTDLRPPDPARLRREYGNPPLRRAALAGDPLAQFNHWFGHAVASGITEPNAMILATVDGDGRPSARVVLLKGVDEGFVFYTNLRSRKGRELSANPHAALVFNWLDLARQVRVTGTCTRVADDLSDAYWVTRPLGSRLSAAASPQSSVLDDADDLQRRVDELAVRHADGDVPRPAHWGGLRLVPDTVEFWQGRPDRLHERFRYHRAEGPWIIERLAP
jgi:pyridoxamine 5'-phosphate oxidase